MELREDVPLAPYTTFQIGGPARWFAEARTERDVVAAVAFARERSLPLFVLGGGSNLLVADEGFDGIVLRIASSGMERAMREGERTFSVVAGENWDAFVSLAVEQGCGGIECLAGIPGTVGGTPIQNVGAYGQEVASTIATVRALDRTTMEFVDLPNSACGFAYRASRFNTADRGRYIVTRVDFRLPVTERGFTGYRDVAQFFTGAASAPTPAEVAAAVRDIRGRKGMLLVPGDADCRSAGSFFKNPVVPLDQVARIAAAACESVPQYPAGPGTVKLSAAWLIEQAGFRKGYGRGRARVSSKHTLALVNAGGATAREIIELRDRMIEAVRLRFGVALEMEPVIVGDALDGKRVYAESIE